MTEPSKFTPVAGMHHTGARLASEVFPDAETITVVVPKPFILNVDQELALKYTKKASPILQVRFEAGPQEMPAFLADHWYVKANGVKLYEAAKKDNDAKLAKVPPASAQSKESRAG